MKFFWKEIPFFRIFLFFVGGLMLPIQVPEIYFMMLIGLQLLAFWIVRKQPSVASTIFIMLLFSLGAYVGRSPHQSSFIEKGTIHACVSEVFSSGKCIARVDYVAATTAEWKPCTQFLFVKDSLGLAPGTSFIANGRYISTDSIPDSGWKKFLQQKKVIATASLYSHHSMPSDSYADQYRYTSFCIKQDIHQYLRRTIRHEEAAGLMLSLLMGGTSHLDMQLKSDFRNAGVMHIIAVSGMHLSLLFVCVAELIFLLKQNRRIDLSTLILCGIFIWAYAALTGFSSSVLRAAVMFSVMMCSNHLNRGYHSWNAYFLSATILLFFFPDMLYDLGFHLSYLAVAGIFLSQPLLNKIRFEPNYLLRNIKSAAVMSLAAQLMVSPYLIYLFGTFSPLFLIANLIMVPLSSLLVYMGIVHLFFYLLPLLHEWSGVLCDIFLRGLIFCARALNATVLVKMSFNECLLWYAMMVLMLLFAHYRKKLFFYAAFGVSAILCGIHFM